MEATLSDRLERLKHYATRYELALTNGTESYLIVYSAARTRRVIFDYVGRHRIAIAAVTGSQDFRFAKKASDGAIIGIWSVKWTARTQRDCLINGELPFIGKA